MLEKIFYIQTVLGKNKRPIKAAKFRTMCLDADNYHQNLAESNGVDEFGQIINDKRITRLGKRLRRYWIDEFPQLINFLFLDFQLIGERAKSERAWKKYPKSFKQRILEEKSGLLPAKFCRIPKNFEEGQIITERFYDELRQNGKFKTYNKYLPKILRNILSGKIKGR